MKPDLVGALDTARRWPLVAGAGRRRGFARRLGMESKFWGESECIAVEVGGWEERGNWGSIMCVASASGATLGSFFFLRLGDGGGSGGVRGCGAQVVYAELG